MSHVYLDNSATTKCCADALNPIMNCLVGEYGNASCVHNLGHLAQNEINKTTQMVRMFLLKDETAYSTIFTSGATESNNWIIRNFLPRTTTGRPPHFITTPIEHPSVYEPLEYLRSQNLAEIDFLDVDRDGVVDVDDLRRKIRPTTRLVTVIAVNNEIGTIQPIESIQNVCAYYSVPFHTDATQVVGKARLGETFNPFLCDFSTFSGHKFYSPKGIGGLIRNMGRMYDLKPMLMGGGQQMDARSGTENVPAIAGMGQALMHLFKNDEFAIENFLKRVSGFRKKLVEGVQSICEKHKIGLVFNSGTNSVESIVNFSVPDISTKNLIKIMSSEYNVYFSAGSACSSGTPKPSRIVKAIGRSDLEASSTVRVSFGIHNRESDVDAFLEAFDNTIGKIK